LLVKDQLRVNEKGKVNEYDDISELFGNLRSKQESSDSKNNNSQSLVSDSEVSPRTINNKIKAKVRRKSLKIVQNLKNSVFTPMDFKPIADETRPTNTLRKGLQ